MLKGAATLVGAQRRSAPAVRPRQSRHGRARHGRCAHRGDRGPAGPGRRAIRWPAAPPCRRMRWPAIAARATACAACWRWKWRQELRAVLASAAVTSSSSCCPMRPRPQRWRAAPRDNCIADGRAAGAASAGRSGDRQDQLRARHAAGAGRAGRRAQPHLRTAVGIRHARRAGGAPRSLPPADPRRSWPRWGWPITCPAAGCG